MKISVQKNQGTKISLIMGVSLCIALTVMATEGPSVTSRIEDETNAILALFQTPPEKLTKAEDALVKKLKAEWGDTRQDLSALVIVPIQNHLQKWAPRKGVILVDNFRRVFAKQTAIPFAKFGPNHDHSRQLLKYLARGYVIQSLISESTLSPSEKNIASQEQKKNDAELKRFFDRNGAIASFWKIKILEHLLDNPETILRRPKIDARAFSQEITDLLEGTKLSTGMKTLEKVPKVFQNVN